MLNYIWGVMIVISIIFSVITGKTQNLSSAVLQGAQDSVELILTMCGLICLWSGIMEIVRKSGLDKVVAKILSPIMGLLFPNIDKEGEAYKYMSLNVSANLLGLGNAATPFGLKAMQCLQELNDDKSRASDEMVVFVVMNTASIQLIPTTVAALRQKYGSACPYDIILCVWVTSVCALAFGLCVTFILNKGYEKRQKLCR